MRLLRSMSHIRAYLMTSSSNISKMLWCNALHGCQKELEAQYRLYCLGKISEKEYLVRIKPIDVAIGELEMATLQDNPVLKVSLFCQMVAIWHHKFLQILWKAGIVWAQYV